MSDITAVVLSYNEAELLPLTLPPIKAVSDKVVIVDMGSTDGSLDIYKGILTPDDLVLSYPRENLSKFGFSHARNYGAAHAKTEWILAIDCDEYIVAEDFKKAQALLKTTTADAFSINRLNYTKIDGVLLDNIQAILSNPPPATEGHRRLYRNRPNIKFEGLIHEELWIGELNAFDHCDVWPVLLHHLNQYKTQGSAHLKYGLYSYLSLQAVLYPARRHGTNRFWFTTYPQHNLTSMIEAAGDYLSANNMPPLDITAIKQQLRLEGTIPKE